MASISLVSLNIQRSKHLDLVLAFLRECTAEVVALQEVMDHDLPRLTSVLGDYVFTPMSRFLATDEREGILGHAIFSPLICSKGSLLYAGNAALLPTLNQQDQSTWNNKNLSIGYVEVEKGGTAFRVATAHHTWTPDGKPTDLQRAHTEAMLRKLETMEEFVLAGDFNAPRGGEVFASIASKYKDNIPLEYVSSLDPERHRVKGLELMVDGLFSTSAYIVCDVELISGVSDHKAIVATVSKTAAH